MSDLVGNTEDRFSRIAAHMNCIVEKKHGLRIREGNPKDDYRLHVNYNAQ